MPEQSTASALSPEASAQLIEFARACKTAARAVSLYPAGHPAIAAGLGRLAQITTSLIDRGRCRVQVTSDRLLLGGAGLTKPDPGVAELADLLHRHLIGSLTLNPGADAESWRTLLLLLARAPESVRQDGGIQHLWTTAGGPSIEIEEIDYAEVLREKRGVAAAAEQILAAALSSERLELDESGMRLLLEIVETPGKLQELMGQLDRAGAEHGADKQAAAFLAIVHGLASWLSQHDPARLDPVFRQMGQAAGRLSAGAMLKLLEHRTRPEAVVGTVNAAGLVIEGMTDESVSHFVAGSVVRERGATERLAHAFQALVPDADRQRSLLALAGEEVAAAEATAESFADLWQRVEAMLTSYSDDTYVSAQYARELSGARIHAVDVESTSDDPPDRIAAWLTSVADAALRTLDHQLLLDLLHIEADPLRWRDLAATAATHAEDLVRVGDFDQAWELVEAIVREGGADAARAPHTSATLERFGRGTMTKHVRSHLRTAAEASYQRFSTLCQAIGPAVIPAIAEALSAEQDAGGRRRLREIVLGFGARGRESVRQLMNAPNWEVRRTAASLLRESGGADGLRELVPLLADSEPRVRREAVRALVMNGNDEASRVLLDTVRSASGPARRTLVRELGDIRDERAAPFFCYLVRHADHRREQQLYMSSIEALGAVGGDSATIDALTHALHQRDWRAPFRTWRARVAAAHALRRIGTPDAVGVLRDAAAGGSIGIRAAARSQLEGLE